MLKHAALLCRHVQILVAGAWTNAKVILCFGRTFALTDFFCCKIDPRPDPENF